MSNQQIWAVFMDRHNTTWRELDGLTKAKAEAMAEKLSKKNGWPCYAAPSDTSFDPYEGLSEAEYYNLLAAPSCPWCGATDPEECPCPNL